MTRALRRFVSAAAVILMVLVAPFIGHAAGRPELAIRWIPDSADTNQVSAELSGLDAANVQALRAAKWEMSQWQRLFSAYADQGDLTADLTLPAMLGSYEIKGSGVRFTPQYPLERGVKYRAVFRPAQLPVAAGANQRVVTALFHIPARPLNPVNVVSQVYPTAPVLPENLLKFYIHFSGPMRGGGIYDYIHLLDEKGKVVELPFLQIGEELWDPTMTRLTLFIDPGRIKRGVAPLEEIGPSLQAGKKFTLVIDKTWEDATGSPLKESFRRSFAVSPPDRESMDPKQWKIKAPKAGAKAALELSFPKPVDHALALRVVQVTNEAGERIDGHPDLQDAECHWTFTPEHAWSRGKYQIVVQNTFEDLAGNNIGKPFEVDLFDDVQRRISNTATRLPFEVK